MPIITISRQICSLGDEIAEALSRKLGFELIGRDKILSQFLSKIANPYELRMLEESSKFYLSASNNNATFLDNLKSELYDFSKTQSAILVGFGSQVIFADDKDAVHIRIIAPQSIRIARIKKQYHVSDAQAKTILTTADRKHKRFVSTVFGIDLTDQSNYDITLNTEMLSTDECVASIAALLNERELRRQIEKQSEYSGIISHALETPVFKNPAEIEFAKILDMYQIEWKYEPKTFPVEWDAEGNVKLAFSPDFFLPKFNIYLELTTMNQKYVTEKNKKVKKLRELYPGTNIKIVYKKDFHSLVERFNLLKGE